MPDDATAEDAPEDAPEDTPDDTLDDAALEAVEDADPDGPTDADADDDDDDEIVRLKPKPQPRAPRTWQQYTRIGLVAATFIAAFGLAGGLGWQLWRQHLVARAGHDAQQTAVAYAQVLTSIDPAAVDQNFAAVLNGATGGFKDTYTKASVQLRDLLIDVKSSTQGVVVESAVQSATKDKVVVLLMVDQTVTDAARPDPRVDRSRMKLTMEDVDGRWLASNVELP